MNFSSFGILSVEPLENVVTAADIHHDRSITYTQFQNGKINGYSSRSGYSIIKYLDLLCLAIKIKENKHILGKLVIFMKKCKPLNIILWYDETLRIELNYSKVIDRSEQIYKKCNSFK